MQNFLRLFCFLHCPILFCPILKGEAITGNGFFAGNGGKFEFGEGWEVFNEASAAGLSVQGTIRSTLDASKVVIVNLEGRKDVPFMLASGWLDDGGLENEIMNQQPESQREYFWTSHGFPAAIIYYKTKNSLISNDSIVDAYITVDFTTENWEVETSFGKADWARAWLDVTGLDVEESKALADGITNTLGGALTPWRNPSTIDLNSTEFSTPQNATDTNSSQSASDTSSTQPATTESSQSIDLVSADLGNNWKQSSWFGTFYDAADGWKYHEFLGWAYVSGTDEDSLWIWSEQLVWIWTSQDVFPYLFSHSQGGWLYLDQESLSDKKYYDYTKEKWQKLGIVETVNTNSSSNSSDDGDDDDDDAKAIMDVLDSTMEEGEKLDAIAEIILFGN